MAMVLFNPTHKLEKEFQETFKTHYMGIGYFIKPGEKIKFPDPAARHILTEFSSRGLVVLEYGDEEKIAEKTQEGLEKNKEFKLKQLNAFNETNEAHKHQGLPYLWPKPFLKAYAKEFGLKLIESYKVDDAHLQRAKELRDENIELKQQMKDMNEKFEKLMDVVSDKLSIKPDNDEITINPEDDEHKEDETDIPTTKDGKPDKRFKGG